MIVIARFLLFGAVAFSLSVYGYRAYKKWIAPSSDAAIPDPDRPGPTGPSASTPLAKPVDRSATRGMGFTNPTLATENDASGSESLVQAVIREELARKQGGTAPAGAPAASPSGRSGLFAGSSEPGGADRVSVAAALTGVRLPEDLVPLVGDSGQADPHHVTFLSSSMSAADIGRQIGDELERLGFDVGSESDVVAVATKGAVTLRVTLHPDARNERVDGASRYPTAPPNSVVVDFTT